MMSDVQSIFWVLNAQYFFKKDGNFMGTVDILLEEYAKWLREHRQRSDKKILRNFKNIAEKFHNPNAQKDNKSVYVPIHIKFLFQAVVDRDAHPRINFHLGVVLLNFILREYPKGKIGLTSELILAFKGQFQEGRGEGGLVGDALWLICKCLQGTSDKKRALMRLGESGLLVDLLMEGRLEGQVEKVFAMLLYFISKHAHDRIGIASVLLINEDKFRQPEAIRYVLSTLQEAAVVNIEGSRQMEKAVGRLMVRFMALEQVTLSEKMQNLDLIAFAAIKNRQILPLLHIQQIIQAKLSSPILTHEPMLPHLIRLLSLFSSNSTQMGKILDLAAGTLANNVASRRVFILMHEQMMERQLIAIMSHLPPSLAHLLQVEQQRQTAMKLIICLKRGVDRLGLGLIFWYCCRDLFQSVRQCRKRVPHGGDLELFELFEILTQQDNRF